MGGVTRLIYSGIFESVCRDFRQMTRRLLPIWRRGGAPRRAGCLQLRGTCDANWLRWSLVPQLAAPDNVALSEHAVRGRCMFSALPSVCRRCGYAITCANTHAGTRNQTAGNFPPSSYGPITSSCKVSAGSRFRRSSLKSAAYSSEKLQRKSFSAI